MSGEVGVGEGDLLSGEGGDGVSSSEGGKRIVSEGGRCDCINEDNST